ncbi:hypothetical protein ACIQVO_37290 [Streptomyces sp. NPDC101062]|uniref:hypothetical protein n=1 Tax=unclassified Streptomyces TaxID=2593676 RepID=UPI002E763C01|nr:hypothetical protein [Streptomyces sp. JV176]MEE1798112.1 hypothetical protein [Streptomyces sp. JV176]
MSSQLAGSAGADEFNDDEFGKVADELRGACEGIETVIFFTAAGLAVAGSRDAPRERVEGASAITNSVLSSAVTALTLGDGQPRRPDHIIVAAQPYGLAVMAVGELRMGVYFRPEADLASVMYEMSATRTRWAGNTDRFAETGLAGRGGMTGVRPDGEALNHPDYRDRAEQLIQLCPDIHTALFLSGDGFPVAWAGELSGESAGYAASTLSPLYRSAATALEAHTPGSQDPDHLIVDAQPASLLVMTVGENLRLAAYYAHDADFGTVLRATVRMRELTLDVAPRVAEWAGGER